MKKGVVSKCLTFGLALFVTAGLCACGNAGSETDPRLAKENVYRMQEIELPQMYNPQSGNLNIMATSHKDGRVNLLVRIYDWSASVYKENDYRLISMNEDGTDVKVVELEIPNSNDEEEFFYEEPIDVPEEPAGTPEEGEAEAGAETGEAEGEAEAGAETGEAEGETEAGAETGEAEEETEAGEEEDSAESSTDDEMWDVSDGYVVSNNTWEYTSYYSFSMMADGTVYGMKNHRFEDASDPENYISKSEISICFWDNEGKLVQDVSMGELDDYSWISYVMEGSDNALYVMMAVNSEDYSSTDYYRMRLTLDGNIGEKEKLSEETLPLFNNNDQTVACGDGTVFVVYRDEDDWTKMYYAYYDVAADKVGESRDFPSTISYAYDYNVMMPGKAHDLIYTGNGGIYCWDQGNEAGKPLVNYINSDLYIQYVYSIVELNENSFFGIFQEDWESGIKAGIFTYVKPEDIQDKKVLVMAGQYIDSALEKRVIEYNRNNADYRIVLKEYNSYNSYDDYMAGFNQLNSDIISGNMPDILVNSSYNSLPVENYISKGLIANIDKLIENDEELSQVEFMQNAFEAYRINGKLYYILPDFEVYTMIAKKSLVGDRENWTMEDMQQVLADMGENTKAFSGDTTRNNFISMVMRYCGNQFVDVSTGKCAFNTPDFISMMEYAKTLPSDDERSEGYDEEYWNDYWENYESQYRQNRTLMLEANFWRFDNLAYTINGRIGEEVSYTGFPTESGSGSYIMSSVTYVLSSKSKNLDEAWNFMRYYLTEEYQDEVSYLPIRKDKFYEKSKKATEVPTYEWTDENGEIHVEEQEMSIWINGESIPYGPLSQEQLDGLIAFIESVNNPYYYNEEVMNIINEEIDGFFTGQKPAADVADVIQRRVQNYVDENK